MSNITFCREIFRTEISSKEIICREIFHQSNFLPIFKIQSSAIFKFSVQKRCNFVDAFLKGNAGGNAAYKWIHKESFPPQEMHLLQISHPRSRLFALTFGF